MSESSYDAVPYESFPFRDTSIAHLSTIGRLFGADPVDIDQCRVLEIGSSSGGNLIPMADSHPRSKFLGIDLSSQQIATGNERLGKMELSNLELQHRDVMDISEADGKFDYIICHGVFSWVPERVKEKILQISKDNLTPNGISYISYNVYPGWHMRGMIRDMMVYHTRRMEDPKVRVKEARGLLDFLANAIPAERGAYGMLLKQEVELLRKLADWYLFHEHLEEFNEPQYFHQFAERLAPLGLQYLGESRIGSMLASAFGSEIEGTLQKVARDIIEMEQYMDFLRNRMFRQTLICHDDIKLSRQLSPGKVQNMWVSARLTPENDQVNPTAPERVTFQGPNNVKLTTGDPIMKAAALHLGRNWPAAVAFEDLLQIAKASISGGGLQSAEDAQRERTVLAADIIKSCLMGAIELSAHPPRHTNEVGDKPSISPTARFQASAGLPIANLRHEAVNPSVVQRHVMALVDGNRTHDELVQAMCQLVDDGKLMLHQKDGKRIEKGQDALPQLGEALKMCLKQFADWALLLK